MSTYAKDTAVPVSRTREHISAALHRYGASDEMIGTVAGRAVVQFMVAGRLVRVSTPLPDLQDRDIVYTAAGRTRNASGREAARDQAVRSRWRALYLVITAKLEAITAGIETFDQAFLAHIVIPGGQTVGEWIEPQIGRMIESGATPALIPGVPAPALPERTDR